LYASGLAGRADSAGDVRRNFGHGPAGEPPESGVIIAVPAHMRRLKNVDGIHPRVSPGALRGASRASSDKNSFYERTVLASIHGIGAKTSLQI